MLEASMEGDTSPPAFFSPNIQAKLPTFPCYVICHGCQKGFDCIIFLITLHIAVPVIRYAPSPLFTPPRCPSSPLSSLALCPRSPSQTLPQHPCIPLEWGGGGPNGTQFLGVTSPVLSKEPRASLALLALAGAAQAAFASFGKRAATAMQHPA